MFCQFEKYKDVFKCKHCGFVTDKYNLRKNCLILMPKKKQTKHKTEHTPKIEQRQIPPFSTRVFNFAKAAIKHAVNGSPQCTEEEIQSRLKICKNCELFKPHGDGGICSHENCGCNLKSQQIYLNKLAWADQECPLKKWTKIEKNPENGV